MKQTVSIFSFKTREEKKKGIKIEKVKALVWVLENALPSINDNKPKKH